MLDRSSGNHDSCLPTQALAFEGKPGFSRLKICTHSNYSKWLSLALEILSGGNRSTVTRAHRL